MAKPDSELVAIAISPTGKVACSLEADSSDVRLWNFPDGKMKGVLRAPANLVPKHASFSPDGKELTVAYDRLLIYWDLDAPDTFKEEKLPGIMSICHSDDGNYFAAATSKEVVVWTRKNGAKKYALTIEENKFGVISFSANSKFVAMTLKDWKIAIWDFASKNDPIKLTGHRHIVTGLAFSAKKKMLISSSTDLDVVFWDLEKKDEADSIDVKHPVVTLAVNDQTGTMVFGTRGNGLHVWDLSKMQKLNHISKEAHVSLVRIAPDSRHLLVGYGDPVFPAASVRKLTIIDLGENSITKKH